MTLGIGGDTKALLERAVTALESLATDTERIAEALEEQTNMQRMDRL
jgi:hypothetical protein